MKTSTRSSGTKRDDAHIDERTRFQPSTSCSLIVPLGAMTFTPDHI